MYCNKCGKEITDNSVFCNFCGNKIEVVSDKKEELLKSVNNNQDVNSNQSFSAGTPLYSNTPYKRPISVVLVVLLGLGFLSTFSSLSAFGNYELAVIIYFPIFIIISFILALVNIGTNKGRMKGFFYAICIMVVFLIAASASYSIRNNNLAANSNTSSTNQSVVTTTTAKTPVTTTTAKTQETNIEYTNNQIVAPILLTGIDNQSTDFFDIAGDVTLIDFEGSSEKLSDLFQPVNVDVMDKNGNKVQNVNTLMSTSFYEILFLPQGEYFLNVKINGPWKATISQFLPNIKNPPYVFVGKSKNLSDILILDKLVEIKYNYTGSGNFIAYLIDEYGQNTQLIVSETNSTSGSTTFKGDGGKYLIKVENADGDYVINVDYK